MSFDTNSSNWLDAGGNSFTQAREVASNGGKLPAVAVAIGGNAGGFTAANPGAVADANSAAFQGAVAITPGTPVAAARSLGFICTVAGNVTLTLANASTITLPLQTDGGAFQTLPFAVTNVALAGATGTFWNLV